jgi:hypothetical protein
LRKETGDQNHYAPLPGEGGLRWAVEQES